jgi:hypothetical protein
MAKSAGELSREFREIHRQIAALRKEKECVSAKLRRMRIEVFEYGDGERLVRERKTDKLASLKNLSDALGSEALAKSAWDRLPESTSSWFTISRTQVVRPKNAKPKRKPVVA